MQVQTSGQPPNVPPLLEAYAYLKPRSRLRWWIHLAIIGAYPVVVGLLSTGATPAKQPALGSNAATLMFVAFVEISIFAILFLVAWIFSRASRNDLLLGWRGGLWPLPLSIGYSLALRMMVGVVVALLAGIFIALGLASLEAIRSYFVSNSPEVGAVVDLSALRDNPVYFWLNLTLISFVVGGLREELWRSTFLAGLRALWPGKLGVGLGPYWGVAIAAILFGLGHSLQGPLAMGMTAMLGFGLGAIMVFHRSIWPAVLTHGFFNATSFAVLPWVMEKMQNV